VIPTSSKLLQPGATMPDLLVITDLNRSISDQQSNLEVAYLFMSFKSKLLVLDLLHEIRSWRTSLRFKI
jgi:hypothetical protein